MAELPTKTERYREQRRRKRANKKNRTSVRSLQARQEQSNLQAETGSMPQLQSEAVAETDRANTKGGYKMSRRHTSIIASIIDRIKEHKTIIIQVAVVVEIAVIVSAIMIPSLAPGKDAYAADIARYDGEFVRLGASMNTWGTGLTDRIADVEEDTNTNIGQLEILGIRATDNNNAIDTLQTWASGADDRIAAVEAQNSPPEGYLTGTLGSYTLHAKCREAGNFTANVYLVYSQAFGCNATYEECQQYFYSRINWAQSPPAYNTVATFNGTAWGVSQVWFNIGTFTMTANNETAVAVNFGGLSSAYEPDFAYVEVWPVLK